MSPEHEAKLYEGVLRMVLWDEPQEDAIQYLEVNGITGPDALAMYEQARAERIATIRREGYIATGIGVLWLAGADSFYCLFWYGMGGTTVRLLTIPVLAGAWGLWKLGDGIAAIVMARVKKGPLTVDG